MIQHQSDLQRTFVRLLETKSKFKLCKRQWGSFNWTRSLPATPPQSARASFIFTRFAAKGVVNNIDSEEKVTEQRPLQNREGINWDANDMTFVQRRDGTHDTLFLLVIKIAHFRGALN